MKLWPFKVESGPDDKPLIVVKSKGEGKKFHAEEVSSMMLVKMKETAETFSKTGWNLWSEITIEVDSLAESEDYSTTITRAKFEELCMSFFKECIPPVEKVMKDANLSKGQVHDVVLVRGSTRIPKIVGLVSEFFGEESPIGQLISMKQWRMGQAAFFWIVEASRCKSYCFWMWLR